MCPGQLIKTKPSFSFFDTFRVLYFRFLLHSTKSPLSRSFSRDPNKVTEVMENLAQLEALCERLYNSQDSAERAHAENTLKCFSVNTDYISQCQFILENALTPYALMLASSSLLKQVTDHSLALNLRLDIWSYIFNYLATRGPKLQPFVTSSLIQLLCRVTKFGWFDDERFRDAVKESTNFLSQGTSEHYAIGLRILNQLVSEINQPNPGLPSTQHRRVACSFRDQSLPQIFQMSLTSLRHLQNDVASQLQELALSLAHKCLSFDFVGTSIDESSEEFGTVQIPSSWRPLLEDSSTLQIFFDYYSITKPPLSKEALECLVRLASVRRSLFVNDAARSKFLAHLMTGTKEILQSGQGLADHDNYHEYCRLLGRFRVNYQLSELVNVQGYSDWIRLVAEFTLKSLQSWQWASSSVYYLLGLWSRLVSSVPYLKGDAPSLLDEFVPKITESFLTSRFNSVQAGFPDDLSENPLDNVELLQDQLDCFPYLCRFQYESSGLYIINMMEPILQSYTEKARLQTCDKNELSIIEAKLTWIVHIIAAILKIKQCNGCSMESQEVLDAELSARVLQLINVTDSGLHSQRYGEVSKQRLDRAILTFFQHFRKSYVGDQAMHSSKQLYARLSKLLGLHDHLLLLNMIVGKIATNLKCYTESEEVIDHTLSLFLELASGYMTGKLLLKLDTLKFIIANHTREHFPFLEEHRCSRSRTTFYYTIGWLIFMEDSPVKFKSSMEPLLQVFLSLESTPDAVFRTDAVKYALIGLMRDLRGIAMATNSRRTYGLLFDWLYPAHMPLILKGITHWTDTPEVTTPLLKFMAEFVLNKAQRLTFDSSSPNGILLFREVSKLIVAYGTRILSLPNPADMYAFKYKGIWISLTILSRGLAGNYVNFGVFELYGDRALSDALDIALKMILSIPLADILAFRKRFQSLGWLLKVPPLQQLEILSHSLTSRSLFDLTKPTTFFGANSQQPYKLDGFCGVLLETEARLQETHSANLVQNSNLGYDGYQFGGGGSNMFFDQSYYPFVGQVSSANSASQKVFSDSRSYSQNPPYLQNPSYSQNSFSQRAYQTPSFFRGSGFQSGRSFSRGGRGRFFGGRNRPQCQLCGRIGHLVNRCYYRFDQSYDGYSVNLLEEVTDYPKAEGDSSHQEGAAVFVSEEFSPVVCEDTAWFPDSGATAHLTPDLGKFITASPYTGSGKITVANGMVVPISHIGRSSLATDSRSLFLSNLLHVPCVNKNLLSVSRFTKDNNVSVEFFPNSCVVKDLGTQQVMLRGLESNDLYKFFSKQDAAGQQDLRNIDSCKNGVSKSAVSKPAVSNGVASTFTITKPAGPVGFSPTSHVLPPLSSEFKFPAKLLVYKRRPKELLSGQQAMSFTTANQQSEYDESLPFQQAGSLFLASQQLHTGESQQTESCGCQDPSFGFSTDSNLSVENSQMTGSSSQETVVLNNDGDQLSGIQEHAVRESSNSQEASKEGSEDVSDLTRAYFSFLEILFNSHISFILKLDAATFMHIVGSLESGLKGLDINISSQCATAVDNLAAFYFNNITMGEAPTSPAAVKLAQHIADCPSLFPQILKTLFEIVLFEDCGNQWSLSRPMLSLILISEQIFADLKAQILASQPMDQHQRRSVCFDKLMQDVTRSLDSRNRDKFTQNLTVFRHEFRLN
ncbi:hypothetical protein GQ457_14G020780 [Hibiscus cannabinus]